MLAALALVLAVLLFESNVLRVDHIHFVGLHRVSYDEAYQAAGISPGDRMITLGTGQAERALEAVPRIGEAHVRRRWPATVEVEVVERSGVAIALEDPGSWVLVDMEGRILTLPLTVLPELPRLSGVSAAPQPGAYLASDADALLTALSAAHGQPEFAVVALWRDSRGDIGARVRQLSNGLVLEVALGDDTAITAKIAAIAAIIAEVPATVVPATDIAASDDAASDGSPPDSSPSDGPVSGVILDVSVPHLPVLRRGS